MNSVFTWPNFSRSVDDVDAAAAQARQRGYEAGHQEGLAQAQAEHGALKSQLEKSLGLLAEARATVAANHAAAITRMAFAVLEALMRVELMSNRALIESMVAEALGQLGVELDAVTIHVCPSDLTWLQEISELEIVADATVVEGALSVRLPEVSVEFDLLGRVRELAADTPMADASIADTSIADTGGDSHPRVT